MIEKVECRDRVLCDEDLVRDGSTINKTELCDRLGIETKGGKPDYRKLNAFLDRANLPSEAFRTTAQIREGEALARNWLPEVERLWLSGDRQRWLGEE